MNRIIPIIAAALLGLAAAWFFRADSSKPPEKKSPIAAAPVAAPEKVPVATGQRDVAAAWKGSSSSGGPDPFTSLEDLITLVDGLDMDDELGMVEMMTGIPRLLATDLATTRRLLAELEGSDRPHGELKGMLAMSLLARWMMQEPESSIEYGKNHPAIFGAAPDGEMMQGFAMMGMMMMAKKNPESARSLVEMLPKDNQEEALEMLQMIEASRDPESALKALPADGSGDAASIVGIWARRNPQAALQWVSSQTGDDKGDLFKAVAEGWAKKDWKAAAQWAAASAPEEDRAEIYSAIVTSLPHNLTRENAGTTLAGLPQPLADRVLLSLEQHAGSGAAEPPGAARARVMEILKRNASDEEFQSGASGMVRDTATLMVSKGDGSAAAAWAQSLPPGPAQESAVGTVASEWAQHDPEAASAWLGALPAGDMREKATTQLIEKISSSDPERAFEWAKALTGEEQRTQQIGKVLRAWLPQNPFAAMKAIDSLPEALRAEIWNAEK